MPLSSHLTGPDAAVAYGRAFVDVVSPIATVDAQSAPISRDVEVQEQQIPLQRLVIDRFDPQVRIRFDLRCRNGPLLSPQSRPLLEDLAVPGENFTRRLWVRGAL